MTRAPIHQTNFTAGELSPELVGRTDIDRYGNGARTMLNTLSRVRGGGFRRPGTRNVTTTKNADKIAILQEFEYSTDQTYILEFGETYIRFYRDSGQLEHTPGTPTEITTPYSEAELRGLTFFQSADVLFICHPSHQVKRLIRGAAADNLNTTWTLEDLPMDAGPFQDLNTDETLTLTASAATGNITITASSALWVSGDAPSGTKPGRLVRIGDTSGANWGWARITGFTSSTVVDATVIRTVPTVATTWWRLGLFSVGQGFPKCGGIDKGRMYLANITAAPQVCAASRTNNFESFTPSKASDGVVRDDDGFVRYLDDDQVNAIEWILSDDQGVMFLTAGGPFIGRGPNNAAPTPANFTATKQTNIGSSAQVRPHKANDVVLYTERNNRRVYEAVWRFENERINTPEMTVLSDHIMAGGAIASAFGTQPDKMMWFVLNDGTLVSFTYERDQNVLAFNQHALGGTEAGAAVVESIASIREGAWDQLWLIVKRTINGSTQRYVEFMTPVYSRETAREDLVYMDCSAEYDGAATTTITGLSYLNGETVAVLRDGDVHPPVTVASGQIELQTAGSKVQVGLPYSHELETMPLILRQQFDARSNRIRPAFALILLYDSLGGCVQSGSDDDSSIEKIEYHEHGEAYDTAIPLFNGMKKVNIEAHSDRQPTIKITGSDPVPFNILSITIQSDVGGP